MHDPRNIAGLTYKAQHTRTVCREAAECSIPQASEKALSSLMYLNLALANLMANEHQETEDVLVGELCDAWDTFATLFGKYKGLARYADELAMEEERQVEGI